jgi:heme a synthase
VDGGASGLTGDGRVASYRLATHLGLAFVILGLIAWYVFLLGRSEADLMQARRGREARLFSMSTGPDAFAFPADPAGRAGRGHRRGPRLSDLAR